MIDAAAAQIAANLERVEERIAAACQRAGRRRDEVTLVAVTKTVAPEIMRAAAALGVTDVGENRVQETRAKFPVLRDLPLRWHMIGHLQSNKAGQVVELFQMVHSIDSIEIASHLSRRSEGSGNRLPALLEVNVSGEESKYGFRAGPLASAGQQAELIAAAAAIAALPGLDLQGLMTVAPEVDDAVQARPYFVAMRRLQERLRGDLPHVDWRHLSMGMTGDFDAAIVEGATIIRLGRAIFGPRLG